MKVVFVTLVLGALAAAGSVDKKLLDECKEETGLSLEEVNGYLKDDDDANDEKATKFMVCFFKKSEVIDDDGHLDTDKAQATVKEYMKDIGASDDQETLDCIQEKESVEETVLSISKCVEKRKAELSESK